MRRKYNGKGEKPVKMMFYLYIWVLTYTGPCVSCPTLPNDFA